MFETAIHLVDNDTRIGKKLWAQFWAAHQVSDLLVRYLKPRLHWRFFALDFLKSSAKCGGYTRDIFLTRQKYSTNSNITITVDVARKKSPV